MRWDIEKVFDDFKNKLDETKAWSKSLTGKCMQAQFIVLAYNLLLRMRQHIEESEGLKEEAIIKKVSSVGIRQSRFMQTPRSRYRRGSKSFGESLR